MDDCRSAIWVGLNQRVALWCEACEEFLGNPASVQDVNRMWKEHVDE